MKASFWVLLEVIVVGVLLVQSMVTLLWSPFFHHTCLSAPAGGRSIAIGVFCVCLSVCLSAHISYKPHVQISKNNFLPVPAIRSSYAIRYVLPVLRMTSTFLHNGANEPKSKTTLVCRRVRQIAAPVGLWRRCLDEFTSWRYRVRSCCLRFRLLYFKKLITITMCVSCSITVATFTSSFPIIHADRPQSPGMVFTSVCLRVCLSVSSHDVSIIDAARIAKLDIEMFNGEPTGLSRLPAILLLATAKSAIAYWMENSKSSRVLKIDILSVIDVNKNKNKHVNRPEVNLSALFNTRRECYVIALKCIIFIFIFAVENQTFRHLRGFTNQT